MMKKLSLKSNAFNKGEVLTRVQLKKSNWGEMKVAVVAGLMLM